MEEPARQIQSHVDAFSDLDNVSWADSRFHTGSRRVGDCPGTVSSAARCPSNQGFSRIPSLLNDDSVDVSGGMLVVQAATVLSLAAKPRLREGRCDVAKLTRAAVEAVGKERRPVAGASRHQQNDVSLGRNAGSLRRRCGGSHGSHEVLVWRCRARLPNVLGSFLKCLMTARMLVAGSLLVMGHSSGN